MDGVFDRSWTCCHCGRKIDRSHNLGDHNLRRHEESCLDQQRRERERAARRASREYRRGVARAVKKGGGVVPVVGQLGFDGFAGIPKEVTG